MIEFFNWLLNPRLYKDREEERFRRIIPNLKTSEILEYAKESERFREGVAEVMLLELCKRVKNTGIPIDDWI